MEEHDGSDITVGIFTSNIVIAVAEAKHCFAQENLSVDIRAVTDSATLLRSFIGGKYDIFWRMPTTSSVGVKGRAAIRHPTIWLFF